MADIWEGGTALFFPPRKRKKVVPCAYITFERLSDFQLNFFFFFLIIIYARTHVRQKGH